LFFKGRLRDDLESSARFPWDYHPKSKPVTPSVVVKNAVKQLLHATVSAAARQLAEIANRDVRGWGFGANCVSGVL
jgi:hypothetical protein